jgi:hypothetical protein
MLWSELALARATRDHAEARDGTGQSESAATRDRESSGRRGLQHVRRVIHPSWMSFALRQTAESGR